MLAELDIVNGQKSAVPEWHHRWHEIMRAERDFDQSNKSLNVKHYHMKMLRFIPNSPFNIVSTNCLESSR